MRHVRPEAVPTFRPSPQFTQTGSWCHRVLRYKLANLSVRIRPANPTAVEPEAPSTSRRIEIPLVVLTRAIRVGEAGERFFFLVIHMGGGFVGESVWFRAAGVSGVAPDLESPSSRRNPQIINPRRSTLLVYLVRYESG